MTASCTNNINMLHNDVMTLNVKKSAKSTHQTLNGSDKL